METIGERIKILRKSLNLSQSEFAHKIDRKQTTIAGYENNSKNVLDRTIKDICRVYNVSEWWLKTGEGNMLIESDIMIIEKIDDIMSGTNEFRKKLIKTIVNCTDEDILVIEKFINMLSLEK